MEVHLGVIRDKQAIYSALLQSRSMHRQLAVCFKSDGKLIVRICTVVDIAGEGDGLKVVVKSPSDKTDAETTILFDHIQSIYPIRDFL